MILRCSSPQHHRTPSGFAQAPILAPVGHARAMPQRLPVSRQTSYISSISVERQSSNAEAVTCFLPMAPASLSDSAARASSPRPTLQVASSRASSPVGSRQLPPAPPAPASRCSSPRRAERAPKGPNRPPLGARTKSTAALSDLSVSQVFTVRENSDEPLQYLKLLGEVTTKKIAMKRSIEELDNASPEPVTEYPSRSATRVELLKREMKLAQELQQEEGKLR